MQLGLTFPLQRKLKIKSVPYGAPLDRKYCWDLHCISLRSQDALLLVHCASRYTIVACGLTKFDWEHLTEFAMEQMFEVIDKRYRSGKPMIITTNLSLEQLRNPPDLAHARIYERILERCAPILFSGENFRKQKSEENKRVARMIVSSGA